MSISALSGSDLRSYAAVSYEQSVEIEASLTATKSGVSFSASVEVSISLEARAVLQSDGIRLDLNALAEELDDGEADDDDGVSALIGGVEEGVLEVLSLVADNQISAAAGGAILGASQSFREALQGILDDVSGGASGRGQLERLFDAEDAFQAAADTVLGSPLSETQEALLEFADTFARKAYKAADRILNGRDPGTEQARLFRQAERAFSNTLNEIFSEKRDVTRQDEDRINTAVVQLQASVETSISAQVLRF